MAEYKKILLALDFFDHTDKLCQHTGELAERFSASTHYIHVVEPVMLGMQDELSPIEPLGLEQELLKQSASRMQELAERHGVKVSNLHIELGSPKNEILRVAEENDVDLIVTGSHGRHGVGLLLGSTANAVLHGANCDVLAVRLKQD